MRMRVCGEALVVVVMMAVTVVQATRSHHQHHQSGTLASRTSPNFNDILQRLDTSIQEKRRRLRGLPPHHYRTETEADTVAEEDEHEWDEEVTVVEEGDTQDYLNNAPWQRRRSSSTAAPIHDQRLLQLAAENTRLVKEQGKCEVPQQRCEEVRSSLHAPGTLFWPRCALLHRCAHDTGCCNSDQKTCAPITVESVNLYFFVVNNQRGKVDMLTFMNHTRCSCQLKTQVNTDTQPNCKCPQYFVAMARQGSCTCDCPPGRSKCRRYKKGRKFFTADDTECVTSGMCAEPQCDYGPFLPRFRRCTKRRERERYSLVSK